jgi:hypothetical protein
VGTIDGSDDDEDDMILSAHLGVQARAKEGPRRKAAAVARRLM